MHNQKDSSSFLTKEDSVFNQPLSVYGQKEASLFPKEYNRDIKTFISTPVCPLFQESHLRSFYRK